MKFVGMVYSRLTKFLQPPPIENQMVPGLAREPLTPTPLVLAREVGKYLNGMTHQKKIWRLPTMSPLKIN